MVSLNPRQDMSLVYKDVFGCRKTCIPDSMLYNSVALLFFSLVPVYGLWKWRGLDAQKAFSAYELLWQGDALYAMELALSLEKLNFIKLRELHKVACDAEDAQLADFIGEHTFFRHACALPGMMLYIYVLSEAKILDVLMHNDNVTRCYLSPVPDS